MTGLCMGIDTSVVRKNTECSLRTLKSHWCLASTQHRLRHLSLVWFLSMLSQLLLKHTPLFFLLLLTTAPGATPPLSREGSASGTPLSKLLARSRASLSGSSGSSPLLRALPSLESINSDLKAEIEAMKGRLEFANEVCCQWCFVSELFSSSSVLFTCRKTRS